MDWVTTSTILQELKDFRNAGAWRDFVERFHRPVAGFARKLGVSPVDAEDVAQETLAAFAESYRRGVYDPAKGRLSSWLFGIAYRQTLRQRRKDARPDRPEGAREDGRSVENRIPDEKHATDLWTRHWERFVLDQCLDRARGEFPAETFRAFELVVRFELTPPEAARELGVPVKKVYNAKHRVLMRVRALRRELEAMEEPPGDVLS